MRWRLAVLSTGERGVNPLTEIQGMNDLQPSTKAAINAIMKEGFKGQPKSKSLVFDSVSFKGCFGCKPTPD